MRTDFPKDFLKQIEDAGYKDSQRIGREIIEFTDENNGLTVVEILVQLKSGKPWEYIRGWSEFCDLRMKVNENVLIPRVETEKLVALCLELLTKLKTENSEITVIDFGTGSGAILNAIATKSLGQKGLKFIGIDISEKAIEIANTNRQDERVTFQYLPSFESKSDFFKSLLPHPTILLSNPPYIPTETYLKLESSVRDFEPRTALDGGKDGLDVYRELAEHIKIMPKQPIEILLEADPEIIDELERFVRAELPNFNPQIIDDIFEVQRFLKLQQN